MNDKLKNIIVIVTFITIIFGMLFLNIINQKVFFMTDHYDFFFLAYNLEEMQTDVCYLIQNSLYTFSDER